MTNKLANLRGADFNKHQWSDTLLSPVIIDDNVFVKLQDGRLLQNVVSVTITSSLDEFTEMTIKLRVPKQ